MDFPEFMDDESMLPDDALVQADDEGGDDGRWEGYRAGFAAIVGRPNVGKSTLTNVLVGAKVAITSDRPETTRHSVRGVIQREDAQVVLVDTPGYHKPRTTLGKRLNDDVHDALSDVDVVVFCVPANQKIGPGDRFIASNLAGIKAPVVAVVTKTDMVGKEEVMKQLLALHELGESPDSASFADIIAVSARAKERVEELVDVLVGHMPYSEPLYPTDMVTDEPVVVMIAELVREAALGLLHEELPHSVAVQVEEIVDEDGHTFVPGNNAGGDAADLPPLDVHINIYVERSSQKGIVIGKKGAGIRHIRLKSQGRIKKLLGRKANIKLHVKVAKNWQTDTKMLGRLGF